LRIRHIKLDACGSSMTVKKLNGGLRKEMNKEKLGKKFFVEIWMTKPLFQNKGVRYKTERRRGDLNS